MPRRTGRVVYGAFPGLLRYRRAQKEHRGKERESDQEKREFDREDPRAD